MSTPEKPFENDGSHGAKRTKSLEIATAAGTPSPTYYRPSKRSPSFSRRLNEDSWTCQVCEWENPDLTRNLCARCGLAPSETSSPPPELIDDKLLEPFIQMTDNDEPDAIQTLTSTALMASLRDTVESVSSRLENIASEEQIEFENATEDPTYLYPLKKFPELNLSYGGDDDELIFSDIHSQSSPQRVSAINNSKEDDTSRLLLGNLPYYLQQGKEYDGVSPPSPPRISKKKEQLSASSNTTWVLPQDMENSGVKAINLRNNDEHDNYSLKKGNTRQRLSRACLCILVILVVVLSVSLIPDWEESNDTNDDVGNLVTQAPSISSSPFMEPPSKPPTIPSLRPSEGPSLDSTATPSIFTTMLPSDIPISQSPAPITMSFESTAGFTGIIETARFGEVVAMDKAGLFMAAMDASGIVQIYTPTSSRNREWDLFSTLWIPEEESVTHMDIVSLDGQPIVAMASKRHAFVLDLDTSNGTWQARKQLEWPTTGVLAPAVALSMNGKVLAMANLGENGKVLAVQVWMWQNNTTWTKRGDDVIRQAAGSQFLSLALGVSSDAQIFAIGSWSISVPQVEVQTYRFDGRIWTERGSSPAFMWGPLDIAMSNDGNFLAVATPTPGTVRIFHWSDQGGDWEILGGDVLGGYSIAISDTGLRVLVGSPLTSTAFLYDLGNNQWEAVDVLTGNNAIGDQFGASIAMAGDGQTLTIGAPLDDTAGIDAGKALIFT